MSHLERTSLEMIDPYQTFSKDVYKSLELNPYIASNLLVTIALFAVRIKIRNIVSFHLL